MKLLLWRGEDFSRSPVGGQRDVEGRSNREGLGLHSLLQRSPKKGILNTADAPSAHNTNPQRQHN